ncbi:hypothetical protein [Paenisporosarcina quisquiliarum]|uniref:hypothetical protein n=1 Tax=Paenisporosarcina quisquiliarum TaxID=365346 RepID=UPI0037362EED
MNIVNMSFVISIVVSIVGLLALYGIIEAGVRNGINSSINGDFLKKRMKLKSYHPPTSSTNNVEEFNNNSGLIIMRQTRGSDLFDSNT